jgi:hypothetical protein
MEIAAQLGQSLANLQRVFEGMARGLRTMSALLPKADIVRHGGNVRFVSKADSCTAAKSVQSITYGEPDALEHQYD